MKKEQKNSRILEFAFNAACALFNYGGVVLAALMEVCVLISTVYNIAYATELNIPLLIAGLLINALTAALLIQSIREVREAKKQSTLL